MLDKSRYSKASKARWAKVPAEQRSDMMRALAVRKHAMLTVEQRRKNARRMVRARLQKI